MNARSGADVDDVVGAADRVLVVLDDDDRVAQVAQPEQRFQQALVVPLVQSDGRLVQHVHDADQSGADLTGEADALGFTAGERACLPFESEVVQPDVHEKGEPFADLLLDLPRDLPAPALQRQLLEEFERRGDGQLGDRREVAIGNEDMSRPLVEPFPVAGRAILLADVLRQLLADHRRFGFPVAALQIRDDAFEAMNPDRLVAALVEIVETDLGVPTAVEDGVAHRLVQFVERLVDLEPVVGGERLDQLEIVGVASVPATHRSS